MLLKDFAWMLLKDNIVVNWFYVRILPMYFRKKEHVPVSGMLTNKNSVKQSKVTKPFLAFKGYTSGTTNEPLTVFRS